MKKIAGKNTIILTSMSLIFISLIIPAYFAGVCHGQEKENITIGDWFVVPGKKIPVRTGMGQKYRILAMAPSGTRVEALQQDETWVKVKLQNKQTGWMPFRYLTRTHPLEDAVIVLKAKNQDLKTRSKELKEQVDMLSRDLNLKENELKTCVSERSAIKASHDRLKKDASNVVQIKETFQNTADKLKNTNWKLSEAEQKIKQLRNNSMIKWFLAGAAVILLGWLLGRYARLSKKRRSSLL